MSFGAVIAAYGLGARFVAGALVLIAAMPIIALVSEGGRMTGAKPS